MDMEIRRVTKLGVVRAKSYFLCEFGQGLINSRCDRSRKVTSFNPEKHIATADTSMGICGCDYNQTVICDCAQEERRHEHNCKKIRTFQQCDT